MKRSNFRFAALLSLYQKQEDALKQEISGLEAQRRHLKQNIQELTLKCHQVREELSKGEQECDVKSFLQYLDGLQHQIQASENKREELLKAIHEKQVDLKKVWQEVWQLPHFNPRHNTNYHHQPSLISLI